MCVRAELVKKSFTKDRDRVIRIEEIIQADLMGPIAPPILLYKNKYILSVIDDYSRYTQVFVLKTKTETVLSLARIVPVT